LTEAGGGTDVLGGMRTQAKREGDYYMINGAKQFITLGTVADVGILFCKTDPEAGHRGVSCFLLETSQPGFSASLVRTRVLGECWPTSVLYLDNAQAALDDMVEYARVRTAFGQAIGRFQQIQAHIANTKVELEAARLIVYRLGWMLDVSGTSQPSLSSQAKYFAAEVAYHAAER